MTRSFREKPIWRTHHAASHDVNDASASKDDAALQHDGDGASASSPDGDPSHDDDGAVALDVPAALQHAEYDALASHHDDEDEPGAPHSATDEFPAGAHELTGVSRRSFISLMGASLGLAGLAGCRRPEEKILPYARANEEIVPGRPAWYATTMVFGGSAIGLLVESHEGRPTKIEGNPGHPDSLGGTSAWVQASILDLYDPDRSTSPREHGKKRNWTQADAALAAAATAAAAKSGDGLALLVRDHRSPTTAALLDAIAQKYPRARLVRWDPFGPWASRAGAKIAFGKPLDVAYETGAADVIVALDADLLASEGRVVRNARGFADGRRLRDDKGRPQAKMNRLYAVESAFTLTGMAADHRLRLRSSAIARLACAIASNCGLAVARPALSGKAAKFADAIARDLVANKGRALVVAGEKQPPAVHALVHAINVALDGNGRTVKFLDPLDALPEGPAAIADLVADMNAGKVDTLVILDGNPVFDAPADLGFGAALAHVPTSFHLALSVDETSKAATWHLPRAHALESWSDARALDGTTSIVQPLVAPLFHGRTDGEILELLAGGSRKPYDFVRATWQPAAALDFEHAWRRALHDGVLAGISVAAVAPATSLSDVAREYDALASQLGAIASNPVEVAFIPDVHAYDGRFANNGWMQELPDPTTALTWDSAALVSPRTARALGVDDEDVIAVTAHGRTAKLPVLVQPGTADGTIVVAVGNGRRTVGHVGAGAGADGYALRTTAGMGFAAATVRATGDTRTLARTHGHHRLEGRPFVQEADLAEFAREPEFARKRLELPVLAQQYPEHPYDGHKWGMVIDLETCIGCGGCTVACQAENNIPLVGKDGVSRSREMHWIRIDRYFTGALEEPEAVFEPVACQQCENAPCEQVCPVGATTHSPEGLNDMAYNRCIGTRYCANNCPYKVRRFNFFNYAKDIPELHKMQFNPDVTVRSRGVMEKCTYCVQRINHAKILAHEEGRDRVRDGEVVAACQQACPTKAISFGDLSDKSSVVARDAGDARNYVLLGELNVRPRTSYLARVRNRNPELG